MLVHFTYNAYLYQIKVLVGNFISMTSKNNLQQIVLLVAHFKMLLFKIFLLQFTSNMNLLLGISS